MIRPNALKKGDKIALVSLSWGGLGDEAFIHKFEIAKDRLENDFGLEVVVMPHALKGTDFVYNNPELRAKDLMDAFLDKEIKGIFCAIGGTDTIRLLPYIDYDIIKNNPKIFMGYSDSTVNHFMMNKAGLVSFYGPTVMCEFGEYVEMFDYTVQAVNNILFGIKPNLKIESSPVWSNDFTPWSKENINIKKKLIKEEHGYELLQGKGVVTGPLLGGCIDVFALMIGTEIWPNLNEWEGKILLLETSEEQMEPSLLINYLRNLAAQGILNLVKGIVVGKPQSEKYYEEYKEAYLKVTKEYKLSDLPIIYNVNIGHAFPTGILPLGTDVTIDFDNKEIYLTETPTKKNNKVTDFLDTLVGLESPVPTKEDEEFHKLALLFNKRFGKPPYIKIPGGSAKEAITAINECLKEDKDMLEEIYNR